MIDIYIARHGQTEWNLRRRIQGWKDSPLTERGMEQAKELGKRMVQIPFDAIYSSSSDRAYQTAVLLRGDRKIEMIKTDQLMEIGFATWEGRKWSEIEALYPNELAIMTEHPEQFNAAETKGETFFEVQARIASFVKLILEKHRGGTILLVTHSITIKVLINYFRGGDMKSLWEGPDSHWASLYHVRLSDDQARIWFEDEELGSYAFKLSK